MSIEFKKSEEEENPENSWVETGAEFFAFVNFTVSSICIVTCLGFIGCTTVSQVFTDDPPINESLWYLCLDCGVGTSIVFVFAVLLLLGVYQKNPSFLLAYIIFGVPILILMVSTVVLFDYVLLDIDQVHMDFYKDYGCKWILKGVSVVYTLVLWMLCYFYAMMRSNQEEKNVV